MKLYTSITGHGADIVSGAEVNTDTICLARRKDISRRTTST